MVKSDRGRFVTGMTGVYAVATELSAKGYIVTVTSRNAPHVDIMASTPDFKKTFNIQVKASWGNPSFWLLNEESKNVSSNNLIYVFVNLKENKNPDFYIVPSKIVSKNVDVSKRKNSCWYSFQRNIKYKDRWDFLK